MQELHIPNDGYSILVPTDSEDPPLSSLYSCLLKLSYLVKVVRWASVWGTKSSFWLVGIHATSEKVSKSRMSHLSRYSRCGPAMAFSYIPCSLIVQKKLNNLVMATKTSQMESRPAVPSGGIRRCALFDQVSGGCYVAIQTNNV